VAALIAGLLGLIAGYTAIAYPSCTWLWPQSDLCGVWSPLGALAGAILAVCLTLNLMKRRRA
jgi:hypothetical protein